MPDMSSYSILLLESFELLCAIHGDCKCAAMTVEELDSDGDIGVLVVKRAALDQSSALHGIRLGEEAGSAV